MVPVAVVVVVDIIAVIWWWCWCLCGCCCSFCGRGGSSPCCCCGGGCGWSSCGCGFRWLCWSRGWPWRPRTRLKVWCVFRSTNTALTMFTPATLDKEVTLCGEVGEPSTLCILAALPLTFFWRIGVSVVFDDVVLREVAGTLDKVATNRPLVNW